MANQEPGRAGVGTDQGQLPRQRTARRRLLADRAATWLVTAGGLAIIASILAILVFIVLEVWPLTRGATVDLETVEAAGVGTIAGMVTDEHRSHLVGLAADGTVRALELATGRSSVIGSVGGVVVSAASLPASPVLSAATADGRVVLLPVEFSVSFDGDRRAVVPTLDEVVEISLDAPAAAPPPDAEGTAEDAPAAARRYGARLADDGRATVAAYRDGRLTVISRTVDENLFSGETTVDLERSTTAVPYELATLVVDERQQNLFAGTPGGELLWWRLDGAAPRDLQVVSAGGSGVTALALLIGGQSLVVGQENGALSVWFPIRREPAAPGEPPFRLTRIRDFPALGGAVAALEPSRRGKGFLAAAAGGEVGLYHSTSHRLVWSGSTGFERVSALTYAPKADGAFVAGTGGGVAALEIDNPHPETTWKTLFGKVHYEGYDEPELVWQSSGATDEVEPKLSLTPLLVGTLKGTFYSLLIAIPLAILGAMYLSQFMHPAYKRYVKPVIEIMASLPSVVLGFLAGLWLAPRVEDEMPALLLMFLLLPLVVLGTGWLYTRLPRRVRSRVPSGSEMFLFALTLAGGIWLASVLGEPFEALAFGGDFQAWLREVVGLPYDQRNAVVVGLAMGFAVIPIIFAISEDAFSNVPQNLVAGSLALGANRWQTVTRVVLPTASPGIFSAVMVGFGRAVGETMIVLMATGNTPIMDWNPFNGFRTLSANIAVEIPEAPQHGTLYRTLFLAALLLFALTFVLNTVAELVRQRLRQRYSQL